MARGKKVSAVFIGKVSETYRVFSFRRLNVVLKSLLSLGFYILFQIIAIAHIIISTAPCLTQTCTVASWSISQGKSTRKPLSKRAEALSVSKQNTSIKK